MIFIVFSMVITYKWNLDKMYAKTNTLRRIIMAIIFTTECRFGTNSTEYDFSWLMMKITDHKIIFFFTLTWGGGRWMILSNIIYSALGADAHNNYARIHFLTFTLKSCDSPSRITLSVISRDPPAFRNYSLIIILKSLDCRYPVTIQWPSSDYPVTRRVSL